MIHRDLFHLAIADQIHAAVADIGRVESAVGDQRRDTGRAHLLGIRVILNIVIDRLYGFGKGASKEIEIGFGGCLIEDRGDRINGDLRCHFTGKVAADSIGDHADGDAASLTCHAFIGEDGEAVLIILARLTGMSLITYDQIRTLSAIHSLILP